MFFKQIYDEKLAQFAYLIGCQQTGEAILIDPMRDIDQYYREAEKQGFEIIAAVDTHIHADYLSGLRNFALEGIKVYASDEGGEDWKYDWLVNSDYNYAVLTDGETFSIGNVQFETMHTPGHTPESLSFLVTDGTITDQYIGICTGDFVFVNDVGRPDLLETAVGEEGAMKPAAKKLYQSVERFKELPEYLQVWPAHGAGSSCGKALSAIPESTVGYEIRFNPAFNASESEEKFVDFILDDQPDPPLYFDRMKKVNRSGVPVLDSLPDPQKTSVEDMLETNGTIVDTRSKHEYMNGHIPGSLFANFHKDFNTIAGSYIDPEANIYLVIDESNIEQAVRDLIRVGLDNIKGYATPDDLESWQGDLEKIQSIDFEEAEKQRENEDKQILDVRSTSEYNEGHIPEAINIAHTRLADHLNELPEEKQLLVHCSSGQRASYASGLLAKERFNLQWIDDDFENWEQEFNHKVSQE